MSLLLISELKSIIIYSKVNYFGVNYEVYWQKKRT